MRLYLKALVLATFVWIAYSEQSINTGAAASTSTATMTYSPKPSPISTVPSQKTSSPMTTPHVTTTPENLSPCINCNSMIGVGVGLGVSFLALIGLTVFMVITVVMQRRRRRHGAHPYMPIDGSRM